MRHLPYPRIRDKVVLRAIANNRRLAIYPRLLPNLAQIHAQYEAYWDSKGNAAAANAPIPAPLNNEIQIALRGFYQSPPEIIRERLVQIRDRASPDVCPMCGSLKTGTLDHVFPKGIFPEFSIFSKNLVPACDCNTFRNECYRGANGNERVMHPYFDARMNQRLVQASIIEVNGNFETPSFGLEVCIPATDAMYPTVQFHLNEVVLKTNVIAYLEDLWPKLIRFHQDFFSLPDGDFLAADFTAAVDRAVARYDRRHATPNNWESMLFAGLANNRAAQNYLAQVIRNQRAGIVTADQI